MSDNISFYKQTDYKIEKLEAIIENIFKEYQIIDNLDGKKVLLKVNLLMGKSPDQAITTNPDFE